MKKTTIPAKKKLLLSVEKVRTLTTPELENVAGGTGCGGTFASMKPTAGDC
jgi:hypothetical protein